MKTFEEVTEELMEKYADSFKVLALYDTGLSLYEARIHVLYDKFCEGTTTDEEDKELVEWAESLNNKAL